MQNYKDKTGVACLASGLRTNDKRFLCGYINEQR